jgi:hypothetical protein
VCERTEQAALNTMPLRVDDEMTAILDAPENPGLDNIALRAS